MPSVLRINESVSNEIQILELEGTLDTLTSAELEDRIEKLIEAGSTRLLFDLTALTYISSAGLRVFLGTTKQLENTTGKFVLCCLQPKVTEIFDITGFAALFEIFATRQEALNSFL